jgi:hypothetical protein
MSSASLRRCDVRNFVLARVRVSAMLQHCFLAWTVAFSWGCGSSCGALGGEDDNTAETLAKADATGRSMIVAAHPFLGGFAASSEGVG